MINILKKLISPSYKMKSSLHFQMCVFNSMSLFFGILMLFIILQVIIFQSDYGFDDVVTYLVVHNSVISLLFFVAFTLGKTKHYKKAIMLFHFNFFVGCFITMLVVGNTAIFENIFPYLGIQFFFSSFFYDYKKIMHHFIFLVSIISIVVFLVPDLSAKEYFQAMIFYASMLALTLVAHKMRAKIIQETVNDRLRISKQSRVDTLSEINRDLSHELNNPLAIISSANQVAKLEIIKDTYNKERVLALIDKSESTVLRISNTIKLFNKKSEDESKNH